MSKDNELPCDYLTQGEEVKAYQEGGKIISNQSLVIQRVTKRDSGHIATS